MKLIVTVDTEADNQWKGGPSSISNVFELPKFQALCEKYSIAPTYFVTYEVVADSRAADMLSGWQNRAKAEVGAHLHPWTNPPLVPDEGKSRAFPSELSDMALRAKFEVLTNIIERNIARPTSYRAGRWGFDIRQAKLLEEFGYVADSSITPGISWKENTGASNGIGGPDFSRESAMPRMLNDSVLEVPPTILRTGLLWRKQRWLRIFENTTPRRLKNIINTANSLGLPAIVFMIHSSELVAGKSPYVKSEDSLTHVYACLEALFVECRRQQIDSMTMTTFTRSWHI